MVLKVTMSELLSLLLLLAVSSARAQVFDVTKFGAVPDEKTDISKAIGDAWKEACAAASPAKVLIPKGIFLSNVVSMQGPCKASMEFALEGTLKAPADPAAMNGEGWINFEHVDDFTMSGGGTLDGQGQAAWKENNCDKNADCKAAPMNMRLNFINNGVIHDITSLNSKNFHINLLGCNNLTMQHVTVTAPAESINTDGIHVGRSKGVKILDTNIGTGDDCISVGDGTQDLTITGVKCGPGHGISIGSLGRYENEEPVSGITVKSCTLTGTDNGVRVKSWPSENGGAATNMHFEDITMDNVKNPVLIDQAYCPYGQCEKNVPSKVKISDVSFVNIQGTSATQNVVTLTCSSGNPCENVELSNIKLDYKGPDGPAKSNCTNVKPTITGTLSAAGC